MTDLEYLKVAYQHAEEHSTDPSTNNGAILVDADGYIKVRAANHFPTGVSETPERWERPLKYEYVEHAERNAVYQAAKQGIATAGLTMYVPWYACTDCARAIIQSGIGRVVGHLLPEHENNPRWKESIAEAMTMLDEAGVDHQYITGKIGGIKILMNGEWVEP